MKKVVQSKAKRNRQSTKRKAVIGVGKFESGVSGLGSNKKHLRGYGS
jgi:hypothetical protein